MENCVPTSIAGRVLLAFVVFACVRSAPVTNQVRLLSQNSGRFVQVLENGTISAKGRQKDATVFNMYLKNSQIQFETKSKPGMFLMLKEITTPTPTNSTNLANATDKSYALGVGYSSESNLTTWEKSGDCGTLSQSVHDGTICSIAFDEAGNVIDPCHVVDNDCIAVLTT